MGIRTRKLLVALTLGMLCAHIISVVKFGSDPTGQFISDFIQLAFGLMLVPISLLVARRSTSVGRHYWHLTALAYFLWDIAQVLATIQDMAGTAQHNELIGFLFYFWYVPIGMALFLDPESDGTKLDRLAFVDLIQGLLFLITAYIYFFLLSNQQWVVTDLEISLRNPYLVVHSLIAAAFLIRAWLTEGAARRFLGQMGLFLGFSCAVDVLYYYGPGKILRTGEWFDILWSVLLIIPLLMAITWREEEPQAAKDAHQSTSQLVTQMFTLLFPALILVMSAGIARRRMVAAATVVLASFACSSARLLLTQKRLLATQDALRREATHDGLTSAWNHAAILSILERELERAQRSGTFLGVMMVDVDRFKSINDSYGHASGDSVLRALTREIQHVLRSYDALGRYGGEEFLIVSPGCGLAEAHELAERIRTHIAGLGFTLKDATVPVTISVGVTASTEACTAEQLLQQADSALYVAKSAGRNRVELSERTAPPDVQRKTLAAQASR
jgi:diguanylate cyclase (GGDEF)-like protein